MSNAQAEKMKLSSMDIAEEKRAQLKQLLQGLLPEAVNESGIDFEQLKRALGEWVEPGKERFGLQWPGKAECMKIVQQPSVATLKPVHKDSVNFDETQNLYIEGDNLEVLKLLQKSYFGKVKMIYIDPPYNTGNEFIYPDKFAETLETYLEYTGQKDSEGRKFSTNTDSQGRYHSRWLNMMYPRVYLAKNLLREDGLLFVSIDENEVSNLKHLIIDIFGEENFVNTIVWKKRYNAAKEKHLAEIHEYILVFAKNMEALHEFYVPGDSDYYEKHFNESDEFESSRGKFMTQPLEAGNSMDDRANLRFPIKAPDGSEIWPRRQWVWGQEKVNAAVKSGHLKFYKNKDDEWKVRHKQYMRDEDGNLRKVKPFSIYDKCFTQDGTKNIEELFNNSNIFPFPKPVRLLSHLLNLADDSNGIYLDFFSGSGSLAQAILEKNTEDGGNRKFILVQLPEFCDSKSDAAKAGLNTIAEIGKERVRKVINRINDKSRSQLSLKDESGLDLGFKVFKLDRSNFKVWEGSVEQSAELEKQLSLHVDHIAKASTPEDILYELLLKAGFALTTKVEKVKMAGKEVFSIHEGALLICLEKELTQQLIDALAEANPVQVICLDEGFNGNDQLKANAVQTFKARAQAEESEIVFKTV